MNYFDFGYAISKLIIILFNKNKVNGKIRVVYQSPPNPKFIFTEKLRAASFFGICVVVYHVKWSRCCHVI